MAEGGGWGREQFCYPSLVKQEKSKTSPWTIGCLVLFVAVGIGLIVDPPEKKEPVSTYTAPASVPFKPAAPPEPPSRERPEGPTNPNLVGQMGISARMGKEVAPGTGQLNYVLKITFKNKSKVPVVEAWAQVDVWDENGNEHWFYSSNGECLFFDEKSVKPGKRATKVVWLGPVEANDRMGRRPGRYSVKPLKMYQHPTEEFF